MLQPKKTKFKKQQKNINNKNVATKGINLNFGEFGIRALENARISARQIESTRIVISKHLKKGGKMWIRIFPDKPITKKPIEVRQGKGKGDIEFWAANVNPGKIIFEISGLTKELSLKVLKLASYKLPIKTSIITK